MNERPKDAPDTRAVMTLGESTSAIITIQPGPKSKRYFNSLFI